MSQVLLKYIEFRKSKKTVILWISSIIQIQTGQIVEQYHWEMNNFRSSRAARLREAFDVKVASGVVGYKEEVGLREGHTQW